MLKTSIDFMFYQATATLSRKKPGESVHIPLDTTCCTVVQYTQFQYNLLHFGIATCSIPLLRGLLTILCVQKKGVLNYCKLDLESVPSAREPGSLPSELLGNVK